MEVLETLWSRSALRKTNYIWIVFGDSIVDIVTTSCFRLRTHFDEFPVVESELHGFIETPPIKLLIYLIFSIV